MPSITLKITSPGGAQYGAVTADLDDTVLSIKKEIQARLKPKTQPCRQRLTIDGKKDPIVLDDLQKLSDHLSEDLKNEILAGKVDEIVVNFKDLGPQIAFRPVYIFEYAGPWLIYILFAMRLLPVYGDKANIPLNINQKVAFLLWMVHYSKRLLETIFVHEFGTLTMPIFNLFKNCAYYWGFAAAVGWNVNIPREDALPSWHLIVGFPWFCVFMILNFICHMRLKYMRPKGTNAFVIPHGGLFEYITCPNYFCEIMTWFGFNILTGFTPFGVAFNIVGTLQMLQWATQRKAKFVKLFGDEWPKKRWVLFPFIY